DHGRRVVPHAQQQAPVPVPDLDLTPLAGATPRRHQPAVRAEGDGQGFDLVSFPPPQGCAGACVPQSHGEVITDGGEPALVGAEGGGVDDPVVTPQGHRPGLLADLPDQHVAVAPALGLPKAGPAPRPCLSPGKRPPRRAARAPGSAIPLGTRLPAGYNAATPSP